MAAFRTCPRKHFLRYEQRLVPAEESLPLRVGSAFHRALEARDKGLDPAAEIDARLSDPYDVAMVAAMFDGHVRRYDLDEPQAVRSELPFRLPLINPETDRQTPVWMIAGVIDRIVQLGDGRLALMEYKTTSRDFAPGAEYWTKLHMDQQLSVYVIAARAIGYDVSTILYDVTRRPALRPLKATPEEARKYTKDGRLYAAQRDRDETPEEYAARVAQDIADRPDHYFARIEVARLEDDLRECQAEIWQQQLVIRLAQRSGHWYRNPGACFGNFNCEYLPFCQTWRAGDAAPGGFRLAENIHPELIDDHPAVAVNSPELAGPATLAG